jgi:pimeloyl-ACP methyl ester carboxylesterase
MKPVNLHYKTYGQGAKSLIIMHGLLGTLDNWQSLAVKYSKDFKVYSLDMRDHGKSPHTEGLSYHFMAEDLKLFMQHQGISEAIVMGHSMGAKAAMFFTYYYPELVSKLIAVDMAPFEGKGNHDEIFYALRALDLDEYDKRSQVDDVLAINIKEWGVRQFLLKNLDRTTDGFTWKMNLEGIYASYHMIREAVPFKKVFKKPTLFLKGALSSYIKHEDIQGIRKYYPNAELKTINNAGHWVHAENPKDFYEASVLFMKSS